MSALRGDLRPSVLLVLWLAKQGGEHGLEREELKKRIRGNVEEGMVDETIDELRRNGFVGTEEGSTPIVRLSHKADDWLAASYDLEMAQKMRRFDLKRGRPDLPPPSDDYRERLPRTNWLQVGLLILISIGLIVASHFVRRLG